MSHQSSGTIRIAGDQLALSVQQVAFLLDISVRSVWRLTSSGELPCPVAIGRSRRWLRQAIDEYLARKAGECPALNATSSAASQPQNDEIASSKEVINHA